MAHPHAHGDHGPHGPARSADKYGCVHHELVESAPKNHTPFVAQAYELSGARRLQSGGSEFASIRIFLDVDRLLPGR